MLTSVLKNHALDYTERGQRARGRIVNLFQNRHTIDHLAGNGNLWIPLQNLWEELKILGNCGVERNEGQALSGRLLDDEWRTVPLEFDVDCNFSLD